MEFETRAHSVPRREVERVLAELDAMTADQLMNFWSEHRSHSRNRAAALFPGRQAGYVLVTRDLAHYASNLATSRACAQRQDRYGESLYRSIADAIAASL